MLRINSFNSTILASALLAAACSNSDSGGGSGGSPGAGGLPGGAGASTGGTTGTTGGVKSTGGASTVTGGVATVTGGVTSTNGGSLPIGGASGGSPPAGGGVAPGGAPPAGGTANGGSGGSAGGTNGGSSGGSSGGTPSGITVKLDATHQTIQGFGVNDALAPSGSSFTATQLDNLFTTKGADALGLSILRIGMNPQGGLNGSTTGNIDGARSRGAKIIGSCWSPPADCKTNNSTKDGGHTKSSCYGSWSDTITSFAKQYNLYAMSIANEPDFASCGTAEPCNGNYDTTLYTANEMVAWVKIAGPKLQAAGIKVISPEASEWLHNWSNESAKGSEPGNKNSSDPMKCGFPASNAACEKGDGYDYGHWLAKDEAAWKAFDIMGVHQYDTHRAEPWPADVTVARKEVWQTEMSGVKWWPEQGPSNHIDNGVAVAGWLHSALTVGEASAWIYWWYQAYYTDDNEGLLLKGNNTPTKRYYTFGNYTRYVRPGYIAVEVQGNTNADLLISAYKSPEGAVVVVAINKGAMATTVPINIAGGTAPAMMTPNVTSATDNLKAGTAVPVSAGSFMASLPGKSVTTFVSQ